MIVGICEDVYGRLFVEGPCIWLWSYHLCISVGPAGKKQTNHHNNKKQAEHEVGKNEGRLEFVKIDWNPCGQTGTHICVSSPLTLTMWVTTEGTGALWRN